MTSMDPDIARRERAKARRATAILRRGTLQAEEPDGSPVYGDEALTLVARLTRESWSLSGHPIPTYSRRSIPCRFVPGRLT